VGQGFYQVARRRPQWAKQFLRNVALRYLRDPTVVDQHFTPRYQPWDQRLCVAPSGDLFRAIRAGTVSMVTDHIDRFVASGVRLASGEVLEADIVVSATGLQLLPFGGMRLTVDDNIVKLADTVTYRGVMLSGVPNFAYCLGYSNASWTLRADLSSQYVCRLLRFMARHGYAMATPTASDVVGRRPLIDLTSGYVLRSVDELPKRGDRSPWTTRQNYPLDLLLTACANVRSGMTFVGGSSAMW
jgi:cation diffusion facilitator CzcD-associated flavoprotein CzcO